MNRISGFILAFILVAAAAQLAFGSVPGDRNGDKTVSQQELTMAENLYKQGNISTQRLEEITYIHQNYPRKVNDSLGQEIIRYQPVKKIVSLNSNADELLRSIKAEDRIIAVDDSTKNDHLFFPEMADLPSVGTGRTPDTEKILELHPDMVIIPATWDKSYGDALQKALNSADPNITVARFDCYRLETYENETDKIAYLLEKKKRQKISWNFMRSV